jgi:DNA-binding FrmR family transcriptional regulator
MKDLLIDKKTRRSQNANHVSRIIGQLQALKRLMKTDASCYEIATLALTVRNSVNSLSVRILEGFIVNHLLSKDGSCRDERKLAELRKIIDLYR